MRRLLTSGIFVVFCFLTVTILAQVPQLLNYQGRLTDDKGIPTITPTTLRFSLYQGGDAAIEGSGTLVYREEASVTPDDNGVFSHLIGSGSVIFGALDSTVFQTAEPVYLEITVDPAGANETLLPRKQIVTVGYSFKSELADDADTVDGQDASAFAPVIHNHDPDYVNEGQADSVTSAMIVNGTIVDADINAGANIAASKIDPTGLDADLLDGKDSEAFVHTTGDDMTGTLNVNTATQYALYGKSSTTISRGVYGWASATSGTTYGVYGQSASTGGYGVYGEATTTSGVTYGVYGTTNSSSGFGVFGKAPVYAIRGYGTASSGLSFGVLAKSDSTGGYGVYAEAISASGTTYGIYGKSDSPSGYGVYGTAPNYGVYGRAEATSGTTYGVYGKTNSPSGYAGYFEGNAHVTGDLTVGGVVDADLLDGKDSEDFVHTTGDDMTGTLNIVTSFTRALYGKTSASQGSGVYGEGIHNILAFGVYGKSVSPYGSGVFGEAPNTGVYGKATSESGINYGVHAVSMSNDGYGVYGEAPTTGVYGIGIATTGVNYGVFGTTNSAIGFAGYFGGNVHVSGNFTVGGTKDCVQPIDNGKKVLLYAMESPEIWFEDFGTAQLVNGQALVQLESVFTQAANIEMGYLIFLTPIGECQGLYIAQQDKDAFEVRELGGGTSNNSFYYRIVAKRRGYEEVRFEQFTEPEQTPAEPNLPVEKKAAKLQQPQR